MSRSDIRTLLFVFLGACGHASATPAPPTVGPEWAPLQGLLGSWEGRDEARHSSGRFTLAPDLGGKVLLRRNANDTPQGPHEDLMVIYHAPSGLRASYFDNEGHVIEYAIAAEGSHVTFTSDEVANMPRFLLTYDVKGADELAIDFAIKPPGAPDFQHYTGGTVHRAH